MYYTQSFEVGQLMVTLILNMVYAGARLPVLVLLLRASFRKCVPFAWYALEYKHINNLL